MHPTKLDTALFHVHEPLNQVLMAGEIQGRDLERLETAEERLNDLRNELAAETPPVFDQELARAKFLAAIRARITPEVFAEAFAKLPAYGQRELAKRFFTEPPVRHRITINKKGKLASPKQPA